MPNPIKRIFDLYTSDLSYQDIEKLIKREAGEVYEFFAKDIPKQDQSRNKISRGFVFLRSLFNAFLLKLTPGRRIFYLAALLFFIVGYTSPNTGYVLLAFIILNLLLAFELADKLTAKSELDVARKIQFDLIPKHSDKIYNYEIVSYYEPAREVGGDYYDVIETPEQSFLFIGDISGKGMAAALYMVRVQAILYLLLESFNSVKDILINLKKYFSKNLRREYFLTLTAASINKDGQITLARAGHLPAYWFKYDTKEIIAVCPQGMGIGLNDKGIFEKMLDEISFQPLTNDVVLFFTDGLSETMNIVNDLFGEERIKSVIQNNIEKSAEDIKSALLKSVSDYRGTAFQNDDMTFLILKAG
jgi:serine phosphatase RsbU (regulator of sigma subunit)